MAEENNVVKQDMDNCIQDKLNCTQESANNSNKELNLLWRRVKTSATLLTYLKSKARIMSAPHLANSSCGIELLDGVALSNLEDIDYSDDETVTSIRDSLLDDGVYTTELLKSVQMVTDVMETLVKRAILAESETAIHKEKVIVGQAEINKKVVQIESMSVKLEEMEQFATDTNSILNEMRQRVEDLVDETSRQRERAAENEHELSRVKRDFESLKSYVSTLISVRETLLSSEKQFQTIERHLERLVAKTAQLESDKMQKDAEVQKLMEENVRLSALLDNKEAQLVAMNEQCKVMALSSSNL